VAGRKIKRLSILKVVRFRLPGGATPVLAWILADVSMRYNHAVQCGFKEFGLKDGRFT
jgi:hypothetical protein